MKKIGIFSVLSLLLVGLIAGTVFAFPIGEGMKEGRQRNFIGNEDVNTAIENNDYDAFVKAVEESGNSVLLSEFDEEKFNELVENHNERIEQRALMEETREKIEAALESSDFSDWYAAIQDCSHVEQLTESITEDNFDKYVELHEAKEKVRALSEELGLERGFGRMNQNKRIYPQSMKNFGRDRQYSQNRPN